MGLKKCEKCGEAVEEAKAFCPECGNPFVEEEKREGSSEFDNYAGTINFSKSVYKMMLSDIEYDTSGSTETENKQKQPMEINNGQISAPDLSEKPLTQANQVEQNSKSGLIKWIIIGLVGALFLLLLVIAILLLLYLYLCC